jgi:hypothetical protein
LQEAHGDLDTRVENLEEFKECYLGRIASAGARRREKRRQVPRQCTLPPAIDATAEQRDDARSAITASPSSAPVRNARALDDAGIIKARKQVNCSARFVTIVPGGVNAHSAGFVFAGFAAQKCASPLAFLCVGQVALC